MLGTSDKGLVQRQQEVMKQQDAMLEDIGKGVNRLYVQAKNIGEETKTHVRLLDDLEGMSRVICTLLTIPSSCRRHNGCPDLRSQTRRDGARKEPSMLDVHLCSY